MRLERCSKLVALLPKREGRTHTQAHKDAKVTKHDKMLRMGTPSSGYKLALLGSCVTVGGRFRRISFNGFAV